MIWGVLRLAHHEALKMHKPHEHILEGSLESSTSRGSTASHRPSAWPGGVRETAGIRQALSAYGVSDPQHFRCQLSEVSFLAC